MVVVADLVDDINNIHPKNKQDVGKRLANWALPETYGMNLAHKSPAYKSMKKENNKIRIFFDNGDNGLVHTGKKINHFQIAGNDKKFVDAVVEISGNTVVVYNPAIKDPVAVRYCFNNTSLTDLFNKEGLPVAPFRTDNWVVE